MKAQLPPTAAALVALIGRRLAMALIAHMNGSGPGYVYVPMRAKTGHVLVGIIGPVATEKLCAKYGGRTLRVPQCNALRRADRNSEIQRMAAEGKTQTQIGRRFGLTDRQVRNVLAK
jgi:hypothetical protein